MVLCSDLEISVNDFWTSTPYEFNGLMRGAYQRQLREAGRFYTLLEQPTKGKKIELSDYVGFKLYRDIDELAPEEVTADDIMKEMSEEDRREFAKNELSNIFEMFD